MKRILIILVSGFCLTALCSAQTRIAEINKGIFHQEGIASWYGGEFNGRPTASGEVFNDTQFTAAHPILPFGTMLKVTNQHNNKMVMVRVNDRGPFVAARIIDLSRAAALQLDMLKTGTAPVKVESLHEISLQPKASRTPVSAVPPQTTPAVSAPAAASALQTVAAVPASVPGAALPASPGEAVQIQPASVEPYSGLGGIASAPAAQSWGVSPFGASLTAASFHPAIPEAITGKNYRVQVGAYKQPEYAAEAFDKLKKAGLNPAYEQYGEYRRVVIAGLPQSDLKIVSERLGSAGFRDVLLREE